ncbi:16S rRNA (cytosine(967)-C(5))-methyltransferase RsmB [Scytonema sp. UIC 10036]|uniref:16S rRNA (cytosine(967)-C(5))-methyltransferase RsmB n=1 Tax=Scytonema sp. UIC 10036 TaxID=2304196 RepID=UPI0012DA960B|nr:16S rRNA (cytosine(967)-C(5))-methyltransferase RsmB [Scytonema sp. UIC 10036]MUG96802.1 16S rRNA (cytosine(967)-C(5))-methyltransferase RsmB [Scytonema sp. UIC 10036]
MISPRQLAFTTLRDIHKGAYVDVALDRALQKVNLSDTDRRLVTELVYGCTRRQRTLDAIIDQLGKKKSHQQPKDLRTIIHLGLYQLQYQERIPVSAAVNTTVQLAKENGFSGLTGVVNGLLRQYIRMTGGEEEREKGRGGEKGEKGEDFPVQNPKSQLPTPNSQIPTPKSQLPNPNSQIPNPNSQIPNPKSQLQNPKSKIQNPKSKIPIQLPENPVERLGILHSFPDWIVQVWVEQFGLAETEQLCMWMNKTPAIDLRVNLLRASMSEVEVGLQSAGVSFQHVDRLPQALRLLSNAGPIQNLPGYEQGWWTVQDSSAQLVSHLLDPQSGETIIDVCAAPGGKTTHITELMGDKGKIFACDKPGEACAKSDREAALFVHRTPSRVKKLQENIQRLSLQSIQIHIGDSTRDFAEFQNTAHRVLLDAPCSGLGTLHRHADARWRQKPETVEELSVLQQQLMAHSSTFVKLNGVLVYSTCTLHPKENEGAIESFLADNPNWEIEPPGTDSLARPYSTPEGWIKVLPHQHDMDGFFMVRLRKIRN